jgi:hypothetical protein
MFLMGLTPFNGFMVFAILLEGFVGLCQRLLLALAADPVGDGESGYPWIASRLDSKEFSTPRANDFQVHGFLLLSPDIKKAPRISPRGSLCAG